AELVRFHVACTVVDPLVDGGEAQRVHGIALAPADPLPVADAVILAVGHRCFADLGIGAIAAALPAGGAVLDLPGLWEHEALQAAGLRTWRL
ncbi:MAG: nucleotide sugar dehydrogenase, partial [Planctomycetota bacterium]